jgi:hypothetical protein
VQDTVYAHLSRLRIAGELMAGLRAAGRQVFAIIPFAVPRYRDRYRA